MRYFNEVSVCTEFDSELLLHVSVSSWNCRILALTAGCFVMMDLMPFPLVSAGFELVRSRFSLAFFLIFAASTADISQFMLEDVYGYSVIRWLHPFD